MRDDNKPHPGQWRIMQVDSGTAGLIVAAGFALLGLVVAPLFTLPALVIGVAIAFVLRHTDKSR
jgi:NhaP-type Na+/H+ and K+/H+ antiporter